MSQVNPEDIVITSTGLISREVYSVKDRKLNFYMMGSMGAALGIGIGLAINLKNKVIVISGDGGALMGLGSLVTAKKLNLSNLKHYILDNGCHETTGGQETSSNVFDFSYCFPNTITFRVLSGGDIPPRIPLNPKQITKRFKNAIIREQKKQGLI